jgi:hypothetical protein
VCREPTPRCSGLASLAAEIDIVRQQRASKKRRAAGGKGIVLLHYPIGGTLT